MGQMTFTFETEEKEPEKGKEIEKVKTEKKPKAEKKEIKKTNTRNKVAKKTKAHQMAKEQRDIPVSNSLSKIDIYWDLTILHIP